MTREWARAYALSEMAVLSVVYNYSLCVCVRVNFLKQYAANTCLRQSRLCTADKTYVTELLP